MREEKGGRGHDILILFTVVDDSDCDWEGAYRGLVSSSQILLLDICGHYFGLFCDCFV